MPDFNILTPEDYGDIEREAAQRGEIPALRMAVKKLQRYALVSVLPQVGISALASKAEEAKKRLSLPEGR